MSLISIKRNPFLGQLLFRLVLATCHRFFRVTSSRLGIFGTYDFLNIPHRVTSVKLIDPEIKVGIVVQGPIISKVTPAICAYYKDLYPGIPIVLSTWVGEDLSSLHELADRNFFIIESLKPKYSGPSNINLQIASTKSGISHLRSLGCTHILKTRTDVLLANPSFLNYLNFMHKKGDCGSLVFSSYNSFLFRLYSPTDQVIYGSATDMDKYWDVALLSEGDQIDFPERYLFKKYSSSLGFDTLDTYPSYLTVLRHLTVIADHEVLGQIWNKGTYTSLSYRWRGTVFPNSMSMLSTWHWENLSKDTSFLNELYENL